MAANKDDELIDIGTSNLANDRDENEWIWE
jgi:hypothetical protein